MIRHALAAVLHALAHRIDPEPAAVTRVTYTTGTTPYPFEVWCGSRSSRNTA